MNKILTIFTVALVCAIQTTGFCGTHERLDLIKHQLASLESQVDNYDNKAQNDRIGITLLQTNIQYLENQISKQVKKAQERLTKYAEKISSAQTDAEIQKYLDKQESAKIVLDDLNTIVKHIESLKAKLEG